MKQLSFLTTCLLLFTSVCFAQTEVAPRAFVERLLKDELMSPSVRGSKVSMLSSDNISDTFIIKSKNPEAFNRTVISRVGKGGYNLFLFFENEDMNRDDKPDWALKSAQVAQFVQKYWAGTGLKRVNSIDDAVGEATRSRGLLLLSYEARAQDITVFTLSVQLRLSDGAIGELSTIDNRTLLDQVQKSEKISDSTAVALVQKILTPGFMASKVINSSRRISRDLRDIKATVHIENDLTFEGSSPKQEKVNILASYNERTKEMALSGVIPLKESRQTKPFTAVSDVSVSLTSSGLVYFTTTRDVESRPWWQRVSSAYSIGAYDLKEQQLKIMRPIPPTDADYTEYRCLTASASGEWLMLTIDSKLAMLNSRFGRLYYPERDKRWKQYITFLGGEPKENWRSIQSPRWRVDGASWWGQTNEIVLALRTDASNTDLYVAKWNSQGEQQGELTLFPLKVDGSDNYYPCADPTHNRVAYASKTTDPKTDISKWTFEVVDVAGELQSEIDVRTAPAGETLRAVDVAAQSNVKAKNSVILEEEPLDISWDGFQQRWLVSTSHGLIQIKQEGTQLKTQRLPQLSFGVETVVPLDTSDALPDGTVILSANLPQPLVSEKSEAVIVRSLFKWDGKSNTVVNLFDQTQNGIARYQFAETSTPWAKLPGQVK